MTCHVAMLGAEGAVMFSDSQASTLSSQYHGLQKQCAGSDFLLGAAGNGLIIDSLFGDLNEAVNNSTVDCKSIETFVTSFLKNEIAPEARAGVQLLLATPTAI